MENKNEMDIEVRATLQEGLEELLTNAMGQFFVISDVQSYKLNPEQMDDIEIGALITVFTKKLAFIAAKEPNFDHLDHLQQIFAAISELFARTHKNYVEVLKDKDKKNLGMH